MPFIVTADIRLQVEDDQAKTEEQAKVAAAIEQLSDYLRNHSWPELLKAQRVEAGKAEHRKEYGERDIIFCPRCGRDDVDYDEAPDNAKYHTCGLEFEIRTVAVWYE